MSAKVFSFEPVEIDHDETPLDLFFGVEFNDETNFDEWQIVDD